VSSICLTLMKSTTNNGCSLDQSVSSATRVPRTLVLSAWQRTVTTERARAPGALQMPANRPPMWWPSGDLMSVQRCPVQTLHLATECQAVSVLNPVVHAPWAGRDSANGSCSGRRSGRAVLGLSASQSARSKTVWPQPPNALSAASRSEPHARTSFPALTFSKQLRRHCCKPQ
jgi:hypothetical protein